MFQKIRKNMDVVNVILSLCKFIKQNTLYFGLSKNDKVSQKDKTEFSVHGL
jgi:hypothetical protein